MHSLLSIYQEIYPRMKQSYLFVGFYIEKAVISKTKDIYKKHCILYLHANKYLGIHKNVIEFDSITVISQLDLEIFFEKSTIFKIFLFVLKK